MGMQKGEREDALVPFMLGNKDFIQDQRNLIRIVATVFIASAFEESSKHKLQRL